MSTDQPKPQSVEEFAAETVSSIPSHDCPTCNGHDEYELEQLIITGAAWQAEQDKADLNSIHREYCELNRNSEGLEAKLAEMSALLVRYREKLESIISNTGPVNQVEPDRRGVLAGSGVAFSKAIFDTEQLLSEPLPKGWAGG